MRPYQSKRTIIENSLDFKDKRVFYISRLTKKSIKKHKKLRNKNNSDKKIKKCYGINNSICTNRNK